MCNYNFEDYMELIILKRLSGGGYSSFIRFLIEELYNNNYLFQIACEVIEDITLK